jgi:hypothetical protein
MPVAGILSRQNPIFHILHNATQPSASAAVDGGSDSQTLRMTRAQAFPYCPNWALSWGSRRRRILRELSNAKCDIIALQVTFSA